MSDKSWMAGKNRPQDDPVPETVKPQRRKKNTKRWCGGKEGREHQVETVRHHFYDGGMFADKVCHWVTHKVWVRGERVDAKPRWSCYHCTRCTVCGKIMDPFLPKEACPTFQEQHADKD